MRMCRRVLSLMLLCASALAVGGCERDDGVRHEDNLNEHEASKQTKADGSTSDDRLFTFVRIKYSGPSPRGREWLGCRWLTDYPESDLNFSTRFQEVTGIPTDPDGKVLLLTDAGLQQYPFIYIAEGGGVLLSEDEVSSLREYFLGGSFLMVDDFWGGGGMEASLRRNQTGFSRPRTSRAWP